MVNDTNMNKEELLASFLPDYRGKYKNNGNINHRGEQKPPRWDELNRRPRKRDSTHPIWIGMKF